MRLYELVLVLKTSLPEGERKKLLTSLKEQLKETKISKEEEWGQKPLAYAIKKEIAGFYHFLELQVKNSIPSDFEKRLQTNENVLRHLLIRKK